MYCVNRIKIVSINDRDPSCVLGGVKWTCLHIRRKNRTN